MHPSIPPYQLSNSKPNAWISMPNLTPCHQVNTVRTIGNASAATVTTLLVKGIFKVKSVRKTDNAG